jgi:hypothetical protein
MKVSQFDKYSRYLKGAAVVIALLTYWRFQALEIPATYSFVAQGDVMRSPFLQNVLSSRSIVWDFFGLINRFVTPHSIDLLRGLGLVIVILDLYLLSVIQDYIFGEKFWGFLAVFLAALSPFAIVAGVSGGPAGAAVALVLLFLMALYRNQYMYAGVLAGVCFAANLPGLIMFLIMLLDMLQNFHDRRNILRNILTVSAIFAGVVSLVFLYSLYSGNPKIFASFAGDRDLTWNLTGALPLIAANSLNVVGIGYLILKGRYDVYRTHFHTLMLWITSCAICVAQPSTLNAFVALVMSTILAIFFLQGLSTLWSSRLVPAETLVFLFVTLFLFSDLYANNKFLKDSILEDSYQKTEVIDDVVRVVATTGGAARLVSNFVPAELSVKLGRKVFAVDDEMFALGSLSDSGSSTIYVAKRISPVDSLMSGCRSLLKTSYLESGNTYFVQVEECGRHHE